MLLSGNLALRLPLLVLPGLLALCRLLSPLLRSTVRGALSLGLLALLRSRRNNTLTAEAHTLLLWLLLLLLGRKRLSPLLTRRLLLAGNGSISLLSPLLRCGLLLLLLWPLSPLLWCCQRCTLRCLGLSPLLRGSLWRGGLGRLRLRPLLLLRALPRLRLSSWCLGRLSLGSLHRRSRCGWRLSRLRRSSWCRSNGRRGRGRCSRLLFHVGLCLCGFSCRLCGRRRLVRCLSFRLRNRRMAGGRRL